MKRRALLLAFVISTLASPFPSPPASKPFKGQKAAAAQPTTTERGAGTGVTWKISPSGAPPPGCTPNYNGEFTIYILKKAKGKVLIDSSPLASNASSLSSALSAASRQVKASSASSPKPGVPATLTPTAPLPSATAVMAGDGAGMGAGMGTGGGPTGSPADGAKPAAGAAATPSVTAIKSAVEVDPPDETGTTVTLRSTRTQTRTVTVRRTVVGSRPSADAQGKVKAFKVSQIGDGQIQVAAKPTMLSVTTYKPAAIPTSAQVPPGTTAAAPPSPPEPTPIKVSTVVAVSQISDGQIQAPGPAAAVLKPAAAAAPLAPMSSIEGMSAKHNRRQAQGEQVEYVACRSSTALYTTLRDGDLKDAQGRTGYIASNNQLQYDKPAQSGAEYTSGFTACSNGLLALGPSTVFSQCDSGGFANMYGPWNVTRWGERPRQCEDVNIAIVKLLPNC